MFLSVLPPNKKKDAAHLLLSSKMSGSGGGKGASSAPPFPLFLLPPPLDDAATDAPPPSCSCPPEATEALADEGAGRFLAACFTSLSLACSWRFSGVTCVCFCLEGLGGEGNG